LTDTIISRAEARGSLLKIAAGGVLTGLLTPLLPTLIDKLVGAPGDFRIALVAAPFAVLVAILVRRLSLNPWWAGLAAAVITMAAFVCAVNAAIWVDGQVGDVAKAVRNICAGLAGGFVGAALMALGIGLLPAGPRDASAWLPMLAIGAIAGRAAGGGQRAGARSHLVAVSGLAGRRRRYAGDGLAPDYSATLSTAFMFG
jgi:hypothetical protein